MVQGRVTFSKKAGHGGGGGRGTIFVFTETHPTPMRRNRPIKLENTIPMSSCIGTPRAGPMAGVLSVSLVYQRRGGLSRDTGAGSVKIFPGSMKNRHASTQWVLKSTAMRLTRPSSKKKRMAGLRRPSWGAVPDAWELLAVEGGILERAVGVLHLRAGGTHSDAPGGVKGRVSGLQIPD